MMGRETLRKLVNSFCVVDGGVMYLKCKNFAKTKKNAFEGGGGQMYLKCKKFAKTKKCNS